MSKLLALPDSAQVYCGHEYTQVRGPAVQCCCCTRTAWLNSHRLPTVCTKGRCSTWRGAAHTARLAAKLKPHMVLALQSNAKFAVAVDPNNKHLAARKQEVDQLRSQVRARGYGPNGEQAALCVCMRICSGARATRQRGKKKHAMARVQGLPTVPSSLGQEKLANPFLRCARARMQKHVQRDGRL